MHHILAVCDKDEAYASKLVNYINLRGGFPFAARYFSSVERMETFSAKQKIEVVLASEEYYKETEKRITSDKLILLGEKEISADMCSEMVWKYQSAASLMKQVLDILSKEEGMHSHITRKKKLKVIGFYSPVKRVLQTSFTLTFGQLLAKRGRALYLNLEASSGLEFVTGREFIKDLSDLLYYLQNGKNGFSYYLYSMTEKLGSLELLPPMRCQMDLISISGKEWKQLLYEIEVCTEYEYLLIDLSDSVQGLYEILRNCDKVYTIMEEDGIAREKLHQYEKMLEQCGYEDVSEKTVKCSLPHISDLPKQAERLTTTELAEAVREFLKEDFYVK